MFQVLVARITSSIDEIEKEKNKVDEIIKESFGAQPNNQQVTEEKNRLQCLFQNTQIQLEPTNSLTNEAFRITTVVSQEIFKSPPQQQTSASTQTTTQKSDSEAKSSLRDYTPINDIQLSNPFVNPQIYKTHPASTIQLKITPETNPSP